MVTNARQVFHPAAADKHYRVLLQIVADAGNISRHFHAVSQPNTGNLPNRRVRLLRGRRFNLNADTALEGRRISIRLVLEHVETAGHGDRSRPPPLGLPFPSDQLIDCRHGFNP